MEQPLVTLAQNLQALREARNLSLAELSDQTGVSRSMLWQIESGQSNPTIATLWKIANGLRVPFTSLLRQAAHEVRMGTFTTGEPLTGDTAGYRLYPLVAFDPQRPVEIYYVEIDPGTRMDAEPHQGHAEEHVFVLRGNLSIAVGNEVYVVDEQAFIGFAAGCDHGYENSGSEVAAAMISISYAI
jgi:transcriptional regulator with XRE-family HTH domain